MARLAGIFAGLLGVVMVPLALSGPTAMLLIPAHALFCVLITLGAWLEGWAGRPELARRYLLAYLVATTGVLAGLEIGAHLRGAELSYWGLPWLALLVWGWAPPALCGLAGLVGEQRRGRLVHKAVRRRKNNA